MATAPKKRATAVPKTKADEKKLKDTTVTVEGENDALHGDGNSSSSSDSSSSPVADSDKEKKEDNVKRPDGVKGGEPEKEKVEEKTNPNQETITVDEEDFKVVNKEQASGALTPDDVRPGATLEEDDETPNPEDDSKTFKGERVTPALEVVPDHSRELLGDYNERTNKLRSKFREGRPSNNDDKAEIARQDIERIREEQERVKGRLFKPQDEDAPFVRSTPGRDDAPAFSAAEKTAVSESENKAVVEKIEY